MIMQILVWRAKITGQTAC